VTYRSIDSQSVILKANTKKAKGKSKEFAGKRDFLVSACPLDSSFAFIGWVN
jgi:hypothetical protein